MKYAIIVLCATVAALALNCTESSPTPLAGSGVPAPAGMVLISAAGKTFSLGDSTDGDPTNDTAHPVSFTYNYYMDITEVTQKDYFTLMGINPSTLKGDSLPVYNVTWYNAVHYCNARSKRDHLDTVYEYDSVTGTPGPDAILNGCRPNYARKGYRLPTDAEWEYAARAGSTTQVPWGSYDSAITDSFAWHKQNSYDTIRPVARLKPNAFGTYDMCGNACEWCTDWFAQYPAQTAIDPFGPDSGRLKSLRNSDAVNDRNYLRSAYRNSFGPMRIGSSMTGFRVARVQ